MKHVTVSPSIGRPVPRSDLGYRKLISGSHMLFYRVTAYSFVMVMGQHYCARATVVTP